MKGNYFIPSIVNAGLDPEDLQSKHDFNTGWRENKPKVWKDIWGAGQGVGAIEEIEPIGKICGNVERRVFPSVGSIEEVLTLQERNFNEHLGTL